MDATNPKLDIRGYGWSEALQWRWDSCTGNSTLQAYS